MIITELFAYKIIFVIEILFSMHLLSFYLPKKKYPVCRYILTILSCLLIAIIFPLFKNVSYSWWYSSIMFFILFTCCAISLYFVYNMYIYFYGKSLFSNDFFDFYKWGMDSLYENAKLS